MSRCLEGRFTLRPWPVTRQASAVRAAHGSPLLSEILRPFWHGCGTLRRARHLRSQIACAGLSCGPGRQPGLVSGSKNAVKLMLTAGVSLTTELGLAGVTLVV
jgi:hypothetical protein